MPNTALADKEGMNWLAIGSGVFGAWVLLLILSGERHRRVEDMVHEASKPPEKEPPETILEVR